MSEDYQRYVNMYKKLHANPKRFLGYSVKRYVNEVTNLVAITKTKTMLDYGCGKGHQYLQRRTHELWGGILPYCYDPGVVGLDTKPMGKFDGVICTDVLEHVPESALDSVISEIYNYADKFVMLGICTSPSHKTLPNGENCHITVHDEAWWHDKIKPWIDDSAPSLITSLNFFSDD